MKKVEFEQYKAVMVERVARLEETVDFLTRNGKYDIEFVYKNDNYKSTMCYAKYVRDGLVETALIETYPYSSVKSHWCIENNKDFAVISSIGVTYKLEKKTKRCVCIKKKEG